MFVGTLSYSLYVWQQPFLNRKLPSVFTIVPVNIALVFACALVSYYGLERPFLRMRESLEPRLAPRVVA